MGTSGLCALGGYVDTWEQVVAKGEPRRRRRRSIEEKRRIVEETLERGASVARMRRGFVGSSGMVQTALQENPFSGQMFVFRGKRGDLIKILWWDGDGLCLFAKRLERGRFLWPQAGNGAVSLTQAQPLATASDPVLLVSARSEHGPWQRHRCLDSDGASST